MAQLQIESEDDAVSASVFREAMSRFASTVGVVTSADGERAVGRTATAMMSLSASPPTILVSIDRHSALAEVVARTGQFSVSILAQDQQMIGDAFAGKLGDIDRFLVGVWGEWMSGNPLLFGASVGLDCRLSGTIDTGTHLLFAGTVVDSDVNNPASPLLWHRRRYRRMSGSRVVADDSADA